MPASKMIFMVYVYFIHAACLNDKTTSETKEVALVGSTYTIRCNLEDEYPTWIWVYNATYKEVIANSGDPEINSKYHARERIKFDANKRDIILDDVSIEDAGDYVCSLAAGNNKPARRSDLHLDVDDFGVKDFECPNEVSKEFLVTTTCVTQGAVQAKWYFVSTDDNRTICYVNAIKEFENKTTACPSGKVRITSRGLYNPNIELITKKVHIMLRLSFSVGNTSGEIMKKCSEQNYYIDDLLSVNKQGVPKNESRSSGYNSEPCIWELVLLSSIPLLICECYSFYKDFRKRILIRINSLFLVFAAILHVSISTISIFYIENIMARDDKAVYATFCLPIGTCFFCLYYLITDYKQGVPKKESSVAPSWIWRIDVPMIRTE